MVERIDDWTPRMIEEGPGQYKIKLTEPWQRGKEQRVIEKRLTISETLDLHDAVSKALSYIARTFR